MLIYRKGELLADKTEYIETFRLALTQFSDLPGFYLITRFLRSTPLICVWMRERDGQQVREREIERERGRDRRERGRER